MIVEYEILKSKFHLNYTKSIKILPLFWKRGWHLLKLLLPIINLSLRFQGRPDKLNSPVIQTVAISPVVVLRWTPAWFDRFLNMSCANASDIDKNIAESPQIEWYKVVTLMINGYWSCSSLGCPNINSKISRLKSRFSRSPEIHQVKMFLKLLLRSNNFTTANHNGLETNWPWHFRPLPEAVGL